MTMKPLNKWLMNKSGVLNYWYYDEEEFPFENGHLLIKGGNGSGKSVTTQSFLPLLLDGNKSPQRLDPFQTRSRKMIDYIFGESPEENEKTSYLYMEYKRRDTQEYITTGMGLKGDIAGDKVTSWYFLIKNKRINEDLYLYNTQVDSHGEKMKVPLSEKEMKNLIEREKCGYFVTTQTEYAELVNKYIFQFQTIKEFKEMVDLVVQIRTPKLSNNMGPSVMYDILQRSLPELSANDLRSLTETIQNIDEIKERKMKAKEDLKLVEILSFRYNDYNQSLITQKGQALLSTKQKQDDSQKRVEQAKKNWLNAKSDFDEKTMEANQLKDELLSLQKKIDHLKDDDVYKAKQEQIRLENEWAKMTSDWNQLKTSLDDKETRLRKITAEVQHIENEKYKVESKINLSIEELDNLADDVGYTEHTLNRDSFRDALAHKKAMEATQQWEHSAEHFQDTIETILHKLTKEKELENQLEKQKEDIEIESRKRDNIRLAIESNRDLLERELELVNRQMAEQNEQNAEYVLTKDELAHMAYAVEELFETMTVKELEDMLQQYYFVKKQVIGKEELRLGNELQLVVKTIREKQIERQEWEKKQDPIPDYRKKETELLRKQLSKKGIPFISFYEAVEFVPALSKYEKERIESSLVEMGILDSLIVLPEHHHLFSESDSVLFPRPISGIDTLDQYLTANLPIEYQALEQTTNAILASIAIVVHEQESFVTSFGHYQHGIVTGFAVPRPASIYIGKEARKRYREEVLNDLQEEIDQLNLEKTTFEEQLKRITARYETLNAEYNVFMLTKDVEEVHGKITEDEREIFTIERFITRLHTGMLNLQQDYSNTKRERMALTSGRETPLAVEGYRDVLREVKEYVKEVREIKQQVNDWNLLLQGMKIMTDQSEQAEIDIEETRDLSLQKEREHSKTGVYIEQLKKTIKEKDTGNIERQIEETERRIQGIPEIREDLIEKLGLLKGKIPEFEGKIYRETSSVRFYQELYQWTKELFVQEINRELTRVFDKHLLLDDDGIVSIAEELLEENAESTRDKRQSSRDKMVDAFNEVRVKGLEEYSLNLTDTDAYVKEISDEGYDHFGQEIEKIESLSSRQLIQLTFDGKLVTPQQLQDTIKEQISAIDIALTEEDEKLYREVILDNIGERIRELIGQASAWNEEINAYMKQTSASNGLKLWLQWKPRKASEEGEMSAAELVTLLQKDPMTLKPGDYKKLSTYFNTKIRYAKESYENDDKLRETSFDVLIKNILDYRTWFEFKIFYQKEGMDRHELTKTNYNKLSGGERAMSMYIPLLSALHSKFISASEDAPHIISMDEAFAGVDENNISTMFKLMSDFDMNYILNSQVLWGTYETVDALSIVDIIRPLNTKDVTVMLYKWNGVEIKPVNEEVEIEVNEKQQNMFELIAEMEV